jgi:hypothetical protein
MAIARAGSASNMPRVAAVIAHPGRQEKSM